MLKLLFSKTASSSEFHNLLCENDFFLFALEPSLAGRVRKKYAKKGVNLSSEEVKMVKKKGGTIYLIVIKNSE